LGLGSYIEFCLLGGPCLSTEPEPCSAGGEMRSSIATPCRRSFDPAPQRFRRQVEIWRTLRHPNILQLLGIAYIGDCVYSVCLRQDTQDRLHISVQVSPYMEFGHVKKYLKDHPEADRVLLLGEIASGASPTIYIRCSELTEH